MAPDEKRFKFDMTFNVAHILTTLGMVWVLLSWGSGVNSALAVQDTKLQIAERDRVELIQALRDISKKLDDMKRESK